MPQNKDGTPAEDGSDVQEVNSDLGKFQYWENPSELGREMLVPQSPWEVPQKPCDRKALYDFKHDKL